ncbi:MAG: hypothetical protein R6V06_06200 [Kiritimatiellia bacterium]
MKLIASTAVICLVVGASVFTTRKMIQTEARKTRRSMPEILNTPLENGNSLISEIDKLNSLLGSIDRKLTRLEDVTGRKTEKNAAEIIKSTSRIQLEIKHLTAQMNAIAEERNELNAIPEQFRIMNANLQNAVNAININAKEQTDSSTPPEIITALDWMIEKIDHIDGYFPPLYSFLGAVDSGDQAVLSEYPSMDTRINEVLLLLEKVLEDTTATRKLVTPYIIEPEKRPRPFETEN